MPESLSLMLVFSVNFFVAYFVSCEFGKISKNTFFTEQLWATVSGENDKAKKTIPHDD